MHLMLLVAGTRKVCLPLKFLQLRNGNLEESEQTKVEVKNVANEGKRTEEEKKTAGNELEIEENSGVSCSNSVLPCIGKLREELSCAICLEICYEPSTTTCGHSFCKKCLRVVLDLDEEQSAKGESEQSKVEVKNVANEEKRAEEEKKTAGDELKIEENSGVSCSNSVLPCIDKLREELSCAICLEICYEPSTTTCGHSFCKKCLRSAADKCGKRCPKCRQLNSNGRSCTVNTVLWNTIQLLFPQEVEARKAGGALNNPEESEHRSPARGNQYNVRTQSSRPPLESYPFITRRRRIPRQDEDAEHRILGRGIHNNVESRSVRPTSVLHRDGTMRRRGRPSQDEVAATALRLERENLAQLLGRDGSVMRWRL
ncbi:hypothetical protein LWI29_002710 [Acer saccharum]|uniref:RING-type E3 ubiquitin transferase n=1 Tax=Acer saccharum TaxID=4024 RepID=A0AA39VRI2_ACESA|nr:hypothetical protein LWI29_002710 [Acer saccharum]